jgi:hypothetical protein
MLRVKDIFSWKDVKFREQQFNMQGMSMLFTLMIVSVVLSVLFIFGPLLVMRKRVPIPMGSGAVGLLFFASIGFGYILIEIGQLQRLIIFLGHPIYSITVVIFSMLLASGIGAIASSAWTGGKRLKGTHIAILMSAIALLILFVVYLQPGILSGFEQEGIYTRIGVSLLFLMPLGFFMGFPFPVGLSLTSALYKEHTPWFWAINGAASVMSSVLSICISITWGFTVTLLAGLLCYLVAFAALLALSSMRSRAGR